MTWPVAFPDSIDLAGAGRIPAADARRQAATASEILRRLGTQPGVVLADEVGMGKTFVALSVAAAAAWGDRRRRPVVVMAPSSLKEKWPRDAAVFAERCVRAGKELRVRTASRGIDFFKLLDDPAKERAHIIVLTHGALHRRLSDPWNKLAILQAALSHQRLGKRRKNLPRFVGTILRAERRFGDEDLAAALLASKPATWREVAADHGIFLDDDPVPEAVCRALAKRQVDLSPLQEHLGLLPVRASGNLDARLKKIRRTLKGAFQEIWKELLLEAKLVSPLLILDEAHHLKNPSTRLASLFADPHATDQDVGELSGAFERMLFLTATPFQLGHGELVSVLDRFDAIKWKSLSGMSREDFAARRAELSRALDAAHQATTSFDKQWGQLRADQVGVTSDDEVESWWQQVCARPLEQPERVQIVHRAYQTAARSMREAETALRPWVLRHLRARTLHGKDVQRRLMLPGAGVLDRADSRGLAIAEDALLPFLLAARSHAFFLAAARRGQLTARATFADGLASSYEAFLETRGGQDAETVDELELTQDAASVGDQAELQRYLDHLRQAIPSEAAYARHPKIAATVACCQALWERGEKVLVFCHYRATGRAMVRHLSRSLYSHLLAGIERRTGLAAAEAERELHLISEAFKKDRPLYADLRELSQSLVGGRLPDAAAKSVFDITRRFVRTPLFLGRYYDLGASDRRRALEAAFQATDGSGVSLADKIGDFVHFIVERCEAAEREEYLDALESIESGLREVEQDGATDGRDVGQLPNIRLANGGVKPETRRRLLLAFNTPFFPEILVASNVLAEGVDLHLNCRYVIHHDLCWNPSTLEQRTGRIDRLGAKAERVGQPIHVYLPYIAGTQDEKMYRVVRDRERWFQVVMGEHYALDEVEAEKMAARLPLPEAAAGELAFGLEVAPLVSRPTAGAVTAKPSRPPSLKAQGTRR